MVYEVKPEDLMKYHWDNECSKAKIENGCAGLIPTPSKSKNIIPIKPMEIKDFTPEFSGRTSLDDLAKSYFDSVRKNAGRRQT